MPPFNLKEWLESDPAVPPLVAGAVEGHIPKSPALELARDVANTHKHYGRNPGYREARVGQTDSRFEQGVVKATMRIDWTDPAGETGAEDALDLARRAVGEWRSFFAAHALKESG